MLMQDQAAIPAPPAPPAPPTGVPGTRIVFDQAGVPTTAAGIDALRRQRNELSNQLTSATDRRAELAQELRTADPAARAGIISRMDVLDKRIVQLETDIAQTGRLLTAAPAGVAMTQADSPGAFGLSSGQTTAVSIVFIIFVLCPLAIALARLLWRRSKLPPSMPEATTQRLERMEQAIDTVAVEVERISEGQRFVTKLLAENRQGAEAIGGARRPDAIALPARDG